MNLQFATRCTREEYMNFCAKRHKPRHGLTVLGIGLLLMAMGLYLYERTVGQGCLLLFFCGLVGVLAEPALLPTMRKGAAAKRYDADDFYARALTVTVTDTALSVRGANLEGTLPLDCLTETVETEEMLALVFGSVCTVCIPKRALTDEEWATLKEGLKHYE